LESLSGLPHDAVLVIGDAALHLSTQSVYPIRVDLGSEWKEWTGLPFVFAVWAARREVAPNAVGVVHERLLKSRDWGLAHLDLLAASAARNTGVSEAVCRAYLGDLDYALSYRHLAGLTDFFGRLARDGRVPDGSLSFISAA
jgi:chorismate dehydratase